MMLGIANGEGSVGSYTATDSDLLSYNEHSQYSHMMQGSL